MKKIFSTLLIICMLVCAVSCSKPATETNPVPEQPVPQTEQPTQQFQDVTVYFPDDNMMYLHPVTITVDVTDSVYKAVAESVISGPDADSPYIKPISGDVKVLSATFDSTTGICTVDLSNEFATDNTGGTTREIMAVYSLVDSLCELDGVKSVKINIEGETNPKFGGHFSLETPFEKQESYIKE